MPRAHHDRIATSPSDSEPALSIGQVETLMIHLLRCPRLAAEAAGLLQSGHFVEGEARFALLWSVVAGLAPEHPGGIPAKVAWEVARERVDCPRAGLPPEEARLLVDRPEDCDPDDPADRPGLIHRAYHDDAPGEGAGAYGLGLLRRFLRERHVFAPLGQVLAGDGIPSNLGALAEEAGRRLGRIDALGAGRPRTMAATFEAFESELEAGLGRPFLGLKTGLRPLDELTGGLRGLTLLGAPPNTGKTALVTQLGLGVAEALAENDAVVVLLCLDMPAPAIGRRVMSHASGLTYRRLVQGSPGLVGRPPGGPYRTPEDQAAYRRGRARLLDGGAAGRLVVADRKAVGDAPTAASLRRILEDAKEGSGTRRALLVVDYLQLLPVPGEVAAQGELAVARHQVRMVQGAIEAPGGLPEWEQDAALAVSETRKRVPGSKDDTPMTADDLMGSSRLAYGADCILLLAPMPGAMLARLHGLGGERRELAAAVKAKRDEYAARRESPLALEVVKARDGMYRGAIPLAFRYESNAMEPIEPDERAGDGAVAPPRGDADADRDRRLLAALDGLDGDEPGSSFSLNRVARAAGNMNKDRAREALARLDAGKRVEVVRGQGPHPRYRRAPGSPDGGAAVARSAS